MNKMVACLLLLQIRSHISHAFTTDAYILLNTGRNNSNKLILGLDLNRYITCFNSSYTSLTNVKHTFVFRIKANR